MPPTENILAAQDCLFARAALLRWTTERLAAESGVAAATVRRLEAGLCVGAEKQQSIALAFRRAGVEFWTGVRGQPAVFHLRGPANVP